METKDHWSQVLFYWTVKGLKTQTLTPKTQKGVRLHSIHQHQWTWWSYCYCFKPSLSCCFCFFFDDFFSSGLSSLSSRPCSFFLSLRSCIRRLSLTGLSVSPADDDGCDPSFLRSETCCVGFPSPRSRNAVEDELLKRLENNDSLCFIGLLGLTTVAAGDWKKEDTSCCTWRSSHLKMDHKFFTCTCICRGFMYIHVYLICLAENKIFFWIISNL